MKHKTKEKEKKFSVFFPHILFNLFWKDKILRVKKVVEILIENEIFFHHLSKKQNKKKTRSKKAVKQTTNKTN